MYSDMYLLAKQIKNKFITKSDFRNKRYFVRYLSYVN